MKDKLYKYMHQYVEVRAYGVVYKGYFKGADDESLYLKCETTWVTIPILEVTSLKPANAPESKRIYKQIEGEPERPEEDEREAKRRYFEQHFKLIPGEKEPSEEGGENF